MAINKVEFCGKTLVDLTGTNVTKQQMLNTASALDNTGSKIYGIIPVFGSSAIEVNGNRVTIPEGCLRRSATSNYTGSFSVGIAMAPSPKIKMSRISQDKVGVAVTLDEAGYISSGAIAAATFDLHTLDPADWEVDVLAAAYPVGSVYCSAENVNPGEMFGGTWELVDKEFKQRTIESKDIFTINPDNVSSLDTVGCVLSGHTLALRIALKNKVKITDNPLQMGTINFAKVGVTRLSLTEYGAGLSDALNGVLYFTVNATTGVLNNADLIGSDETSTEETIHYRITQTIRGDYMLDEFCDKFYWKRTA